MLVYGLVVVVSGSLQVPTGPSSLDLLSIASACLIPPP